jgi:UrcA family protein
MEPAPLPAQRRPPQVDPTINQETAMNTFTSLAGAVVFGLVIQHAAYAEPAPKSLTVQFADLDLSKNEGAATLFNRIKGAAMRVCSSHSGGKTILDKQRHAACVDLALSNAVARVDRPELTDYVTGRVTSKTKPPITVASGN